MEKKLHIFTSAACNYIPKVRMLFRSLREHHPEAVLHLALADERTPLLDLESEPFDEVCTVAELGIPDWKAWAFCHSIVELATAIKPFYLKQLLERDDCGRVLYLDPDMVVFSRLDDILNVLEEANLVLTPHQTEAESQLAAIIDNEICSLKHGVFNLGFVGVANTEEGRRFAAWWATRVYHFCRSEIHNGLFTDQKWIDLVPALFENVAISRSPRHNVATWNLTTRRFSEGQSGQFLVEDEPLGFYHFTGFDSGAHRIMVARNAPGNESVLKLVSWYENSTRDLSRDPLSAVPWAYGAYGNGKPIAKAHRFIFRERLDLQRAFHDPFEVSGGDCFYNWIVTQGPREYASLFDDKAVETALVEYSRNITPGFRRTLDSSEYVKNSVFQLLAQAVRKPSFGCGLAVRAISVLRTEGYRGLKRRLRK